MDARRPRRHPQLGHGVGVAVGDPLPPPEVGHTEPCLIQGYVVLLLEVRFEIAQGPPLSQDQCLFRIALEWNPLDLLVLETQSMHLVTN